MTLVGALLLVIVLLLRPMEIYPWAAKLHLLEALTAATTIGIVSEAATRRTKVGFAPQFGWLVAFLAWAFLVTMFRLGPSNGYSVAWKSTGLASIFMVLIGYAMVSLERLRAMLVALAAALAIVAGVAVHQGMQPRQCIELVTVPGEEEEEQNPDGRDCEGAHQCEMSGKPGMDYLCERVGLVGTISTAGRVRYRGQLGDPNEMSVFIGAGLPLIVLLPSGRRRGAQWVLLGAIIAISLWAVILSQSRTGQIVIGLIALVGLVRRHGLKGAIFAAAAVLPVLMLGGRGGAEADSSSIERASILYEGIDLVRAHPFVGVGVGQFMEEISIPMTAHNSYLLAAAELGPLGLFIWSGMLFSSFKVAHTVAKSPPPGIDPQLQRFADALTISLAAIFVGIFTLSFCYKQLLFVWLGMAGGLYGAVRQKHPSFSVRTTSRDLLGLAGFSVTILIVIFVISRLKAA